MRSINIIISSVNFVADSEEVIFIKSRANTVTNNFKKVPELKITVTKSPGRGYRSGFSKLKADLDQKLSEMPQ
jgi:hypothetical protein